MDDNFFEEYDNSLYPLTDMFENVSDKTYLQFCQIACIQYDFLLNTRFLSGYHLVNWRVNFGNLHDFVKEKNKSDKEVLKFLSTYENSVPTLYKELGLFF